MASSTDDSPTPTKFGTFGGVFTPCTLTILGVIMFLRFGQVVGNAGVWNGIGIVLLAKLITTLTALSLSAIATNTRVKGGGAYYLISRSLGIEFGGSTGIVFFIAQAVSVAMYIIGFTEALLATFPDLGLSLRTIATMVNVIVCACVVLGAGWTIKVQYAILAVLLLSLISFFVGAVQHFDLERFTSNLAPSYSGGENLYTMFALFFPAATGIMAGANMSGDLENPGKSIPRGTLLAIAFTGVIYLCMATLLGAVADRSALLENVLVVRDTAWSPPLITAGIFAATLSSALGSMMGAPRILQALARDQLFEKLRYFGHGSGPNHEPRRACLLTFVLAQIGILLGDLNLIAPIITMFFMITYGYLNLATFYESITRNPSYRPTFRLSHWSTALAGALGCAAAMFLISPLWAGVAVLGMGGLHWYLGRKNLIAKWGDVTSGVTFQRARKNLLRLEEEKYHPKNWRPSVLALSGGAWARIHLAVFGHWLTGGRGILTLGQVLVGEKGQHLHRREGREKSLREFIREEDLDAFPAVLVAPDVPTGIEALVQCHGIGALRPNTVLLGWSTDPERVEDFTSTLRTVAALGKSVVLVRVADEERNPWHPVRGSIDIWWRGKANGTLMMLLGHLLKENSAWRGRQIRLLRMIPAEAGREETRQHLETLIAEARIPARTEVAVADDFSATVQTYSRHASVVFLGFNPPEEGEEQRFLGNLNKAMEGLGDVVLVWSAGGVALDQ